MLLARSLGVEGRGLLLALTFWPAFLAGVLNLSLNESVTYHVAQQFGRKGELEAIIAGLQLVCITALGALVTTVLLLPVVVPSGYDEFMQLILLYAVVFIPITHLERFCRAILQGRGAILQLNGVRLIQPLCYFAALVIVFALADVSVELAIALSVIALSISLFISILFARPAFSTIRSKFWVPIASTGWRFHKANLLLYIASETDKVIVLFLLTTTEAGLFAIAIAVSAIGTGIVLQSAGLMLMRDMASSESLEGRQRVFTITLRMTFTILLLVNGTIAIVTPWAVPLLYGKSFAEAVPVTMLLLAAGAFKGGRQMVDKALRALHLTRTGIVGETIALLGIAVLGSIGALTSGLFGLAVGALLAQVLGLVIVLWLATQELKIGLYDLWPFQRAAIADLRALVRELSGQAPATQTK